MMAALIADALNHGSRGIRHRLRRSHDTRHEKRAAPAHAEAEIRFIAVGARRIPLVESPELLEHGPPKGHVAPSRGGDLGRYRLGQVEEEPADRRPSAPGRRTLGCREPDRSHAPGDPSHRRVIVGAAM